MILRSSAAWASRVVVLMSTSKLCKLRLFMPITCGSSCRARCISSAQLTSTSGSMPKCLLYAYKRCSVMSSSIATMSKMVSAPARRASAIWYSCTIKSLRRMAGRFGMRSTACRTRARSSIVPLNQVGSVSTLMTLAPLWAYAKACSPACACRAILPLLGEARLISAMTPGTEGSVPCKRRRGKSI